MAVDNESYRKKIIISDLDGTLSDYKHRVKYYNEKDYFSFNVKGIDDPPIEDVCNILRNCKTMDTEVVIMTARDEQHREATQKWLRNYDIPFDMLLMRPSDDNRYDDEVKRTLFKNFFETKDVWFVIEDRQICVDMWRELGLTCLQPASGDF